MTLMWSGPSRALQFHLELFERNQSVHTWMRAHEGKRLSTDALPHQLHQRLKLMTASGNTRGEHISTDGDTVSLRRDSRDVDVLLSKHNIDRAVNVLSAEHMALDQGETHYVSHSVTQSVLAAAETMDVEALRETDLPAMSGVLVFEYPIIHDDLHPETGEVVPGLQMPTRAIAWTVSNVVCADGRVRPGITYLMFVDHETYRDIYAASYKHTVDDNDYEMDVALEHSAVLRSWLTDSSGWAFGVDWTTATFGSAVDFVRRFLLAYFRWTWQRILVPTPYTPSRAERKWVARVKPPLPDGHIKVLRLRREIEHERQYGTEYQGVYDHQFLVRGHWRRQWYSTLGPAKIDGEFNPESHRLVWVEPFVKGNPMGPLVVGHNVVAATR